MWESMLIALVLGALVGIIKVIESAITKRAALRDEPIKIKKHDKKLDEIIEIIHGALMSRGIELKGSYGLPANIMSEINLVDLQQGPIQALANDMLRFLEVPEGVTVKVYSDYQSSHCYFSGSNFVMYSENAGRQSVDDTRPGYYYASGTGIREIHLFKKHNYTIRHLLAILAHELTHHFLATHYISLSPEEKNEQLTDVAAIFIGFGQFLFEGYKPIKWISDLKMEVGGESYKVNRYKIGYISVSDVAYVMKRVKIINELETQKRRKAELLKKQVEANQCLIDKLLADLTITEMLYENNTAALNLLRERRTVFDQNDLDTIMENSNAHYVGSIDNHIASLKKKIQKHKAIDHKLFNQITAEINKLSTKITNWNSIISKYL